MTELSPLERALGSVADELRIPGRHGDAERLVAINPELDLERVRHNLELITKRGFHRDQDLFAKLDALIGSSG